MNLSELLLIFFVALIVFSPKKLPKLAANLGFFFNLLKNYKQKADKFWKQQLDTYQLKENEEKAQKADLFYQNKNESNNN